jgi:hypothetical protein
MASCRTRVPEKKGKIVPPAQTIIDAAAAGVNPLGSFEANEIAGKARAAGAERLSPRIDFRDIVVSHYG